MRTTPGRTLAAAGGVTGLALMLAACGDNGDVDSIDDGIGEEDVVNGDPAPAPDEPGEAEDAAAEPEAQDEDAPMVVLAGEGHSFQMRCISDPDEPGSIIVSTVGTDVDAFGGRFGFENREDRLFVELDSGSWEVSDSHGEFLSLDVHPDGDYAIGEAVFENQEGDTETGSFNVVC